MYMYPLATLLEINMYKVQECFVNCMAYMYLWCICIVYLQCVCVCVYGVQYIC